MKNELEPTRATNSRNVKKGLRTENRGGTAKKTPFSWFTPIIWYGWAVSKNKSISGDEGWVQSELLPEDWLMKKYNKKGDGEFKIH